MPQVAAAWIASAIGSAATAVGISAATAATITTVAAVVIEAGIYAAAASVLAPKTQAAEGRATEWTPDPDAPLPFVFGQRGVAGNIVHREAWGQNNRYQSIISIYSAAGPISSYGATYVDGAAVTFTGELMDGTPVNRLWRQTKLGNQPESAAHTTTAITSSYSMAAWGSSHKLSGQASSCVTLRQDGDFKYWPTGEPKYIQVVNGLLCYDPRLDSTYPGGSGSCRLATRSTWVYSTNGAIQALNWVIGLFENGVQVGGIGADFDHIDVDAFIAAANVADANSWTSAAACYADAPNGDDKYEVLIGLLQTAGARPASKAGKISCVSMAANSASVATITGADVIGPFEYEGMAPREGRFNTVIPRIVSADHDWENVDLDPVTNSTYVTEDNNATRSRGISYGYVSDPDQAAQLARYDIANSREGISGTITVRPYLRDIDPGECFTIDEPEFGMSSLKCFCLSREYDAENDGVRITFRSETAAKHAWALAGTGAAPATPTLGGDDPTTVPTPSGSDWSIAAGTGETPSIVITGAVPSTLTVSKIVVEHKADAASAWIPLGEFSPEATSFEAVTLANTAWEARLAYRNLFGALGSYLTLGPVTTAGNVATVVDPTTELVIGTGATALRAKDGQMWFGEGGIENANAVLDANGLIQRMADPTIEVGGVTYLDASGFTPAALQQIAAANLTSPPATRVVQGKVNHAASSGAISHYLTTTLLAASDVTLDVSFSLAGYSTSLSDFPSTITVTLYEQYSTDNGANWSTNTAVTGGSVTLTRITSGTPTASEYLVESATFQQYDGSSFSPITYYKVTSPAALTIAVSSAAKSEAMYRWSLVGPTGSAWYQTASTITATDVDDKPSFLVGDVSAGASTPWANPVGHTHELVIQNTSTTAISVTASAITISTATGAVRTVRDVNLTLDCTTNGAGGLDTGSLGNFVHYALYMISDGTSAGDKLLASTSFTAPTMPSGYSYIGRIGAFYSGSGGEIHSFIKKGNRVRYIQTATIDLATLKSGSHGSISLPTWVATSYSTVGTIPTVATDALLSVYTTGNTVMLAPNNTYGDEGDGSNPPYILIKTGGSSEAHLVEMPNEDGNLYSASNNTNLRIRCAGYIDSV